MSGDRFTPLQITVLDAIPKRRLTVVRAGPGSGKTRVFVEALRRELAKWDSPRAGVAALSFTNVAHGVISERLGGTPKAPHFVGTLDAFLLRFIVLPFAKLVGVHAQGARLIPEPVARTLERPTVMYGTNAWEKAALFRFSFAGGNETCPRVVVRERFGRARDLSANVATRVLAAKKADWFSTGRITHSDCQYLASRVLHSPHGAQIANLVARRFPVMLVDEFQDTGWFLGRAVKELLRACSRGLVVGDPDQAIFQFTGADRSIFEEIEKIAGERSLLLDESHRCARRVAAVATALSRSKKTVRPLADAPDGKALLLIYGDDSPDLSAALEAVRPHLASDGGIVVLTRKAVSTESRADAGPWTEGMSPTRLCRAVSRLREGNGRAATQILSAELGRLLLAEEAVTSERLRAADIEPRDWKLEVSRLLLKLESRPDGETWNCWIERAKEDVEQLAARFRLEPKNLGQRLKRIKDGGEKVRELHVDESVDQAVPMSTIHAAKGREFANVGVLVAKPHKAHAPCPSSTWWAEDNEEREVAYVACSRAEKVLFLVVHRETYDALSKERPGFVSLFDVLAVDVMPRSMPMLK